MDPSLLRALLAVKAAAAQVNAELGVVSVDVSEAISASVDELLAGADAELVAHFPVDVFQTGSGTSTNMNANEVLATLATRRLGERVHPNDEVNVSQSSNDVFPTAIRVAALERTTGALLPGLGVLGLALRHASERFSSVVKAGRTHLMDAVPITLGQELGGYATAVEHGAARVRSALGRLGSLPLGGTAVGTGLNAPEGFAAATIDLLGQRLGLELSEVEDHFEAQGGQDVLVELSGALRVVAVSLNKVVTDLRWMASGPATGLGEIRLPDLQPGSSIMPGKVNPVLPEATHQVVAQVIGNDAAVAFAAASGSFELNVMLPVMARNVLESVELLAAIAPLLAEGCVDGLEADVEACRRHAESSPSLVTALVPLVGYEAAAEVAKLAVAERRTIREVVLERGLATPEQLDEALDVLAMNPRGDPDVRVRLSIPCSQRARPVGRALPAEVSPPRSVDRDHGEELGLALLELLEVDLVVLEAGVEVRHHLQQLVRGDLLPGGDGELGGLHAVGLFLGLVRGLVESLLALRSRPGLLGPVVLGTSRNWSCWRPW